MDTERGMFSAVTYNLKKNLKLERIDEVTKEWNMFFQSMTTTLIYEIIPQCWVYWMCSMLYKEERSQSELGPVERETEEKDSYCVR